MFLFFSIKSCLFITARVQHGQYGVGTPQAKASAATPISSQRGSSIRLQLPSGSTVRGRSPSAERASGIGPKATRKDNRPLGDKAFQAEMLSKIDTYLRTIEQSSIVNSNGSLKPITLKMFVEVSDLLIKLLDVKHSLTMANYVEELPKIAKKLHYPSQVNKSWLKTANTMHSWPQVLGWLSWLAETCAVKDLAIDHFQQFENLPFLEAENATGEINRLKFQFLLDAYKAWNEEKPTEEIKATENFLQKVSNAHGVTEETIKNAEADLEAETRLLEEAKETGEQLDDEVRQLEEELKMLLNEESKLDSRAKELEDAEIKYTNETKMIEEETESLKKTFKARKAKKEELKTQINSQPMSVVERDAIVDRCGAMRNQIRDLNKHLEELEKDIWTLDLKLASTTNSLNKVVLAYNKDIHLCLDTEEGINVSDVAMPVTGIANPKIMEELHEKRKMMAAFHQKIEKQAKSMETMIEAVEKDLETLEDEKSSLEAEKIERISKINENKNQVKAIQTAAKAEEIKLRESIENLKLGIKEIQDQMPDIETEERELAEAKEKVDALERRKTYLEESAKLFFDKFFEILSQHRTKLAELLEAKDEGDE